jgi:hypothetical protein
MPNQRKQCRYLRPNGVQCKSPTIRGQHHCYHHGQHAKSKPAKAGTIEIPLLEDRSAIQLLLTQTARGILDNSLTHEQAGRLLWALQIATRLLPKDLKDPEEQALRDEPVETYTLSETGEALGPDLPYYGPNGKNKPVWDFSKWMYSIDLNRKYPDGHQPDPDADSNADPNHYEDIPDEDLPTEGWLTEHEMELNLKQQLRDYELFEFPNHPDLQIKHDRYNQQKQDKLQQEQQEQNEDDEQDQEDLDNIQAKADTNTEHRVRSAEQSVQGAKKRV